MDEQARGHRSERVMNRPRVPAHRYIEKVGEIGLEPTNLTDVNRAL